MTSGSDMSDKFFSDAEKDSMLQTKSSQRVLFYWCGVVLIFLAFGLKLEESSAGSVFFGLRIAGLTDEKLLGILLILIIAYGIRFYLNLFASVSIRFSDKPIGALLGYCISIQFRDACYPFLRKYLIESRNLLVRKIMAALALLAFEKFSKKRGNPDRQSLDERLSVEEYIQYSLGYALSNAITIIMFLVTAGWLAVELAV